MQAWRDLTARKSRSFEAFQVPASDWKNDVSEGVHGFEPRSSPLPPAIPRYVFQRASAIDDNISSIQGGLPRTCRKQSTCSP